jgi:hypothetical protein
MDRRIRTSEQGIGLPVTRESVLNRAADMKRKVVDEGRMVTDCCLFLKVRTVSPSIDCINIFRFVSIKSFPQKNCKGKPGER